MVRLSTGNAVFSSCSVARLINGDQQQWQQQQQHQHQVHHCSPILLFCGSHDKHVHCWQWQGKSFYTKWKTSIDSEVYSIPFVSNISRDTKDPKNSPDKASVAFHQDLITQFTTPPEQYDIVSPVPMQGQEPRHTLDPARIHSQEQECVLVSELEQGQSECDNSRGLPPAQAMASTQEQLFSDIPKESVSVISCQETLTVVCVCSSNGMVYLLDALSGKVLGRYEAPWDIYSSPVLIGSDIVFGCRNDNVYKLSITYDQ